MYDLGSLRSPAISKDEPAQRPKRACRPPQSAVKALGTPDHRETPNGAQRALQRVLWASLATVEVKSHGASAASTTLPLTPVAGCGRIGAVNLQPYVSAMSPSRQPVVSDPTPATYQDVLDAPPHKVAEIIAGTLHTQPRPASPHALASSYLGDELVGPFGKGSGDGPGGWWIIDEPELHLGTDILVPDLAGWRKDTMPDYPDAAFFDIAPDWACEVLSPSTRKIDLLEKRPIYAREGVKHLWFVDPTAKGLEAFELREGQWVLIATLKDDDPVSVPPFDAITFSLADLWP